MTVLNEYVHGTKVRIWGTFRASPSNPFSGVPGALTDPADVDIKYMTPDGSITTVASPSSDDTGIFYTDITANKVGIWRYRVIGDSIAQEGQFMVKPSPFSTGS